MFIPMGDAPESLPAPLGQKPRDKSSVSEKEKYYSHGLHCPECTHRT